MTNGRSFIFEQDDDDDVDNNETDGEQEANKDETSGRPETWKALPLLRVHKYLCSASVRDVKWTRKRWKKIFSFSSRSIRRLYYGVLLFFFKSKTPRDAPASAAW